MQSIATATKAVFTAAARIPKIKAFFSWNKVEAPDTSYAQVDSSQVDGEDIVKGDSDTIVNAQLFEYMDESEYVMRYDYERRVNEPRGGVSYAVGDILLSNLTQRFTPDYNQTIGTALEARRPLKMLIGLVNAASTRFVMTLIGLTADKPKQKLGSRTVDVRAFDYITYLNNQTLSSAVYEDMRSDQIIESILGDLGFGSSQYVLDVGLNTIPFAWFDKNKSAGQRIKELCEAEEAHFYQDENAILRFENRNHYSNAPHQTVQHRIHPSDLTFYEYDESTPIINRAIVTAKPRKVDDSFSVVWSHSQEEEIGAGQTITIWATFFDADAGQEILPIKEIATPVEDTDYDANDTSGGGGVDKSSQIDITITNFVESAKIEITNNDAGTVYLTLLQLRGKAARVSQAIQAVSENTDSINKYEPQEYVVENNLIQDPDVAETIADNLVAKYNDPLTRLKVKIPGIAHLQLKDLVQLSDPRAENLARNPSFELDLSYWSLANPATATVVASKLLTADAQEGSSVAKIVIS